jgi:hypothetical protein
VQLTEHFSDFELGVDGQESRILTSAQFLCVKLLEPIRSQFGPVRIHDGYRSPDHNAAVGGKPASWHQFDGTQSAVDFDCIGASYQAVFDWIRLESDLPFDKVILENNSAGEPRCIHVQVDRQANARREAYVGTTGAGTVYLPMQVN